ncbi:InlB B-repeat-containing protein, partial [Eubacteriales bacterium OttesenSCG-928-A19]|nr:InlB B-repeat-containing protein [Eubacteriales bacterium OttesenSCG-928-A19]
MRRSWKQKLATFLAVVMMAQVVPMTIIGAIAEGLTQISATLQRNANYYQVEFKNPDNAVLLTQFVEEGEAAVPPEGPTYSANDGYVYQYDDDFEWELTSGGTSMDNITANTVFTAKYTQRKQITITFSYVYGENAPDDLKGTEVRVDMVQQYLEDELEGMTITAPSVTGYEAVPESYIFGEGNTAIEDGASYTFTYEPVSDLGYVVKYMMATADSVEGSETYEENESARVTAIAPFGTAVTPEIKDFDGFAMTGFSVDPLETEGQVYEVYYGRNQYTVSFDSMEGTYVAPAIGKFGTAIMWPQAPEREGYVFQGWYASENDTTRLDPTEYLIPAGGATLVAKWEAGDTTYTVMYWLENPNLRGDPGNPVSSPSAKSNYFQVDTMSATGLTGSTAGVPGAYAFTINNGVPYAELYDYDTPEVMGDGSTIQNVYYKRITFTVTWVVNTTHNRSSTGWWKDTKGNENRSFTGAKYEMDISAEWAAHTNNAVATADNGDTFVTSWAVDNVGTSSSPASQMFWTHNYMVIDARAYPQSTAQLATGRSWYARWGWLSLTAYRTHVYLQNPNTGTYTLHSTSTYLNSDSNKGSYSRPEIAGYTFKREESVAKNNNDYVTLNGKKYVYDTKNYYYDAISYTLSFDTQGGNGSIASKQVPNGKYLTTYKPTNPTRIEGGVTYNFMGWAYDRAGLLPVNFTSDTMPTSNITIYAQWDTDEVAVAFYKSEEDRTANNLYDSRLAHAGKTLGSSNFPAEPTLDGMTFLGWYIAGTDTIFTYASTVATDMQVVARWSNVPTMYTVYYQLSNGQNLASPSVIRGVVGEEVSAQYVRVADHQLAAGQDATKTLVLGNDAAQNKIIFVYEQATIYPYTVIYTLEGEPGADYGFFGTFEQTSPNAIVVLQAKQDSTGTFRPKSGNYVKSADLRTNDVIEFVYERYTQIPYSVKNVYSDSASGPYTEIEVDAGYVKIGGTVEFFNPQNEIVIGGVTYQYDPADALNTANKTIASSGMSEIELRRVYKRVYTVTFVVDSGKGTASGTMSHQLRAGVSLASITPPTVADSANYYFDGWDNALTSIVNGDVTVNAKFAEKKVITIRPDAKTYTYGEAIDLTYSLSGSDLFGGDSLAGIKSAMDGAGFVTLTVDGATQPSGLSVRNGGYTIQAAVSGDTLSAYPRYRFVIESGALTINPVVLTLTADDKTKVYGDEDPDLTYTYNSSDVVGGETVTINGSLVRTPGTETVGNYTIDASGLTISGSNGYRAENYTFIPLNGTLTITRRTGGDDRTDLAASFEEKTYDGKASPIKVRTTFTEDAVEYSVDGVNYSTQMPSIVDVGQSGTYFVRVSNPNYSDGPWVLPVEVKVNPVELVAKATDTGKVYGENDPALGYTYNSEDVVGSEAVVISGTLVRDAGQTVGNYNISTSGLTISGSNGYKAENYAFDTEDGTFTITAQPGGNVRTDISASFTEKTYNAIPGPISVTTLYPNEDVIEYSVDGTNYSSQMPSIVDVGQSGTYYVKVTNPNFSGTTEWVVEVEAKINPVELVANVTDIGKVYGEEDPDLEYTYNSGAVVGSENVIISGTLVRVAGETVGTYNIDASDLTISGTNGYKAENYTFNANDGTFTITHRTGGDRATELGASFEEKTYDGVAGPIDVTTKFEEDAVEYSVDGTNYSTQMPSIVDVGDSGTYYVRVTNPNFSDGPWVIEVEAKINPVELTAKATDKSKYYGAGDPALEYTYNSEDVVGSEIVVISGTLVRDAGETVADYNISTSGLTISGSNGYKAENYAFDTEDGTFSILDLVGTETRVDIEAYFTEKTYDGQADEIVVTTLFPDDDIIEYSVDGTNYSTQMPSIVDVGQSGTYYVRVSNPNFTGITQWVVEVEVKVNPVELVAKATDTGKVYGEN